MSDLENRLRAILHTAPRLMHVLAVARELDLPDWMVFSGAVYQPVWNHLTGRDIEHGLKDFDLAYFDASDTTYDAEDRVIRRVAHAFEAPVRGMVEVRNQARVHLWFEARFGEPYTPLSYSAEALTRFTAPAFAVGVRLEADDSLAIIAPFGLRDLFEMRLRPNPDRPTRGFSRSVESVKARWPEVACDDPGQGEVGLL